MHLYRTSNNIHILLHIAHIDTKVLWYMKHDESVIHFLHLTFANIFI